MGLHACYHAPMYSQGLVQHRRGSLRRYPYSAFTFTLPGAPEPPFTSSHNLLWGIPQNLSVERLPRCIFPSTVAALHAARAGMRSRGPLHRPTGPRSTQHAHPCHVASSRAPWPHCTLLVQVNRSLQLARFPHCNFCTHPPCPCCVGFVLATVVGHPTRVGILTKFYSQPTRS